MYGPGIRLATVLILAAVLCGCVDTCVDGGPEFFVGEVLALSGFGSEYVAVEDFNGDGLKDLLLGGNHYADAAKTPLFLLINNGDGSFSERTAEFINGSPMAASPHGEAADFNGDGTVDVAVYDGGDTERGQAPEGGFYGEAPFLLLSNPDGTWDISTALADAEAATNGGNPKVHAKSITSGDIDGDGDIDLLVESGGGFNNIITHFVINNDDGTFTSEHPSDELRIPLSLLTGPTGFWRHAMERLADMDNDGHVDVILTQLRKIDNQQDELHSKVVFNDGSGRFPAMNSVDLPYVSFNDTYTYVRAVGVYDLDDDGFLDLVFAHERGNNDTLLNGNTGRFLQFLINDRNRSFTDDTNRYIGDQSATLPAINPHTDNPLSNIPTKNVLLLDMNDDGFRDLVMEDVQSPQSDAAPLIYFGSVSGLFTAIDSTRIVPSGDNFFGEQAYPLNLDGDEFIDVVSAQVQSGDDGRFGTNDDFHNVLSILRCPGD